jgi:hypothetical protein
MRRLTHQAPIAAATRKGEAIAVPQKSQLFAPPT